MPDPRHLNQPPIVEALVHFQANASRLWATQGAKELAKASFPHHPQIEEQHQLSVQIQPGKADPVQQIFQQLSNGFVMRSSDEPTVHQVRRDGYSYSRLPPYEGWEPFISAAKAGWQIYAHAFQPEELHSLALRFINRLDFPVDEFRQNRESFLTVAPPPPAGLNWGFGGFTHHYSSVVRDVPCMVNLNLARVLKQGRRRWLRCSWILKCC
jgi:uncharacterized protein (TIGR04255 family)